jgi:tRNA pseudouridine38-40 synthase
MSGSGPLRSQTGQKKRNVALWFGYVGTCFRGSQVLQLQQKQAETEIETDRSRALSPMNDGDGTIEGVLVRGLYRIGAISERNLEQVRKVGWSRASRTDKGVHAVSNVASMKLLLNLEQDLNERDEICSGFLDRLNAQLPPSIRVHGGQRVSKGFRARSACTMREYEYILPRWVLDNQEELFVEALRRFEGTHRFHNFSGKERKMRSQRGATEATSNQNDEDIDDSDDEFLFHDTESLRAKGAASSNDPGKGQGRDAAMEDPCNEPCSGAEATVAGSDAACQAQRFSQLQNGHGREIQLNPSAPEKHADEQLVRARSRLRSRFHDDYELAKQSIRDTHPDKDQAPIEHDDLRCVRVEERKPLRRLIQFAFPVAHPDRLQSPYYIRTIYRFEITPLSNGPTEEPDYMLIRIRGQSFVLHQIRLLVGAAVLVARGHLSLDALEAAIDGPYRVLCWRAPGSCLLLSRPSFWDPRRRLYRLVASENIEERMMQFRTETLIPHVCKLSQREWVEFLHPQHGARIVYPNQEQLVRQYRLWKQRASEAAEERRRYAALVYPRTTPESDVVVDLPRGIQTTLAVQFNLLPGPELTNLREQLLAAAERGELPRQPTVEQCLEYCERHRMGKVASFNS